MEAVGFAYQPRVRHRKAIFMGLVIGILVAASVAVAAWLVSGSGRGWSQFGATQPLTTRDLIVGETITTPLFPGADSPIYVAIENPNDADVVIDGVSFAGSIVVDNSTTCPGSPVTWNGDLSGGNYGTVPAGGSALIEFPDALHTASSAATGCQTQWVEVNGLSFTGHIGT